MMRFYAAAALFCLVVTAGHAGEETQAVKRDLVCRVNCGASVQYTDESGAVWQPDQERGPGNTWGAIGGGTVTREKVLPIQGTPAPEVYRSERYNVRAYEFTLPDGIYLLRLHFAETFDSCFTEGTRVFDVKVGGEAVIRDFDPFKAAGGFARPAVVEVSGQEVAAGSLTIEFEPKVQAVAINGIEIYQTGPTAKSVATLAKAAAPRPPASDPTGVRRAKVLFIGNSYTIFWALPETLQTMLADSATTLRLDPSRSLSGGKDLEWHCRSPETPKRIESGAYDYVVLQEYSTKADAQKTREFAVKLSEWIKKSGARPVIYCAWLAKTAPLKDQEPLTAAQFAIAQEVGAAFVPAGAAWQAARQERPDLNLYNADGHHPGMHGAYLTACVFYAVLTGESPEGHPRPTVLAGQVEVDSETAAFLQRVAWQTVQRFGSRAGEQ